MCTSADQGPGGRGVLRDGRAASLRALPYDDPLAQYLVEAVQQEYVRRYGGRDAAVVDPAEFLPPRGAFLVAEVDGVPAGCGAWRALPSGQAEIKRVYVEPAFRRQGVARLVVAALEQGAAAAGHAEVVLNSGREQPEALTLYAELGYRPVRGYGVYACAPDAVFLGKPLSVPEVSREEESSWVS
ncbi:GNAT family N-acetyltransferase [Blastococcus haudaquaticus]|uniref:Acetyltransferase (GNAT) family protein n=1 Tax=Blastococcus haudaquaticus TaxID=1938745 RepID=A0A286GBX8_9ACTN|nr:GNAT family N-acetyltransferase [Blastococcus haudaquaticus]SOD93035.1 Acetyltransferase (GNAT) family protein [Blastococcus haudaquaticus]